MAKEYIWLDSRGAVIVNPDGRPYLSESCCCCDCCSGGSNSICYHEWRASCIDNEGKPVYGSDGTGKVGEEHWTDPVQIGYSCGPDGGDISDRWILISPGVARYRQKIDLGEDRCTAKKCSEASETPPAPTISCNCIQIWENPAGPELPNYTVTVPVVFRYIYEIEYDEHDQPVGSNWIHTDYVPLWDADTFDDGRGTDPDDPHARPQSKINGMRYIGVRQIHQYLHEFVAGALNEAEGFCPETGPEYEAWSAARYRRNHDSYFICTAQRRDGETYTPSGPYYEIPMSRGIWVPPEIIRNPTSAYNNLMFVRQLDQGGTLMSADFAAYEQYGGKLLSAVGAADPALQQVDYPIVYEPGWTLDFGYDQWGYIDVQPDVAITGYEAATGSLMIVREARGASCAKQDVPVSAWELEAGHTSGYPMWHFRTYLLTNADIATVNKYNMDYAMYAEFEEGTEQYSRDNVLTVFAQAPGVFCPLYYILYISEEWGFCSEDPAQPLPFVPAGDDDTPALQVAETPNNGNNEEEQEEEPTPDQKFCEQIVTAETVESSWVPNPYPFFLPDNMSSTGRIVHDYTYWMHEDEEQPAVPGKLPGLRRFSQAIDGHCYKAYRLGIRNFPAWYIDDQCENPITGDQYNVPKCIFTDDGYYCNHCVACDPADPDCTDVQRNCYYPGIDRAMSTVENPCGYMTTYSEVAPVEYNKPALMEECPGARVAATYSAVDSTVDQVTNTTSFYALLDEWYEGGAGCPDWQWTIGLWQEVHVVSNCVRTRNGQREWVKCGETKSLVTQWYSRQTDVACTYGNLTWEGHPADPQQCHAEDSRCNSIALPETVHGGWVYPQGETEETATYRSSTVISSQGAMIIEFARNFCENGSIANAGCIVTDGQVNSLISCEHWSTCDVPEDDMARREEITIPAGASICYSFNVELVDTISASSGRSASGYNQVPGDRFDAIASGNVDYGASGFYSCNAQVVYVTETPIHIVGEAVLNLTGAGQIVPRLGASAFSSALDSNYRSEVTGAVTDHIATLEERLSHYGQKASEYNGEGLQTMGFTISRVFTDRGLYEWMCSPPTLAEPVGPGLGPGYGAPLTLPVWSWTDYNYLRRTETGYQDDVVGPETHNSSSANGPQPPFTFTGVYTYLYDPLELEAYCGQDVTPYIGAWNNVLSCEYETGTDNGHVRCSNSYAMAGGGEYDEEYVDEYDALYGKNMTGSRSSASAWARSGYALREASCFIEIQEQEQEQEPTVQEY